MPLFLVLLAFSPLEAFHHSLRLMMRICREWKQSARWRMQRKQLLNPDYQAAWTLPWFVKQGPDSLQHKERAERLSHALVRTKLMIEGSQAYGSEKELRHGRGLWTLPQRIWIAAQGWVGTCFWYGFSNCPSPPNKDETSVILISCMNIIFFYLPKVCFIQCVFLIAFIAIPAPRL